MRGPSRNSNVDAIYAEYPFLEKLISRKRIAEAQVKRWDDELLEQNRRHFRRYHKLFLLHRQGKIVTEVGWRFFGIFPYALETVGQALARIGDDTEKVRYAVYFSKAVDHLVFYKSPRGFENVADWFRSRVMDWRQVIRKV